MNHPLFIITFTALVACSTLSDAAPVTSSDRSTWRSLSGGGTGDLVEDFNGFASDADFGTVDVTAGFLTFSSPTGDFPLHKIDAPPFGGQDIDGTSFARLRAAGPNVVDTLVEFNPLSAIGFDYVNGASLGDLQVTTSLGDVIVIPDSPSASFFGIAYTEGETITSLLFEPANQDNLAYSSDNWEAFAVPEPASLALLGLGGLIVARRRRR